MLAIIIMIMPSIELMPHLPHLGHTWGKAIVRWSHNFSPMQGGELQRSKVKSESRGQLAISNSVEVGVCSAKILPHGGPMHMAIIAMVKLINIVFSVCTCSLYLVFSFLETGI